ncbi:MAG: thiamine pyrophosphate-binding protein [Rhodospirillales bacterium]
MATATGHRKLLEQLEADGLTTMFGNPGSSEEGLLDEIARTPSIRYILGLQEATVILMAAGYAQAMRRPTVVQLHCSVGVGNGLGSLYHTFRKQRSPLVVIAGEAGVAYDALDAHMALDLVGFARPATKYAARAIHPGSLLRLLRRCIRIAATPPYGPTFLSVPQDILDQANDEPVVPTTIPDTRVAPEPAVLSRAAELLMGAANPVIVIGDGVTHSGAEAELARVAELLGASVYGAMVSEVNIPWSHPLYRGMTGHMFGPNSRRTVADADAVLICGTYVFPDVFPLVESPFRAGARIVHIDLDSYAIGKNHPVTLGLWADPKTTLGRLAETLAERMSSDERSAAATRADRIASETAAARAAARDGDVAARDAMPLRMSVFAAELARQLPADAILYDESITHTPELTRYLTPSAPGHFYQTPGGTLGIAFPGAVGAKLAHPERTVVGFGGDGGTMYTLQALWTAAHHRIAAKFVVCNNRSYRLLKENLVQYWRDQNSNETRFPPSFDLGDPELDFISLARGMGVPGVRVATHEEIAPGIRAMLDHDGPFLLDLTLESEVRR